MSKSLFAALLLLAAAGCAGKQEKSNEANTQPNSGAQATSNDTTGANTANTSNASTSNAGSDTGTKKPDSAGAGK